jgi:purine-nucleoside phosphorylase
MSKEVETAVAYLKSRVQTTPQVMLVLGSGLGALADEMEAAVRIPFDQVPGFHASTVEGHKGMLVAGTLEGVPAIAMQGRFHLYEGHSAVTAALPVRVMAALGARTLIVTNAAGGVNPAFRAGDLMLMDDHINFMFQNPLTGRVIAGDLRFPDMSAPYDAELQEIAQRVARENDLVLRRGVYLAVTGPSYETPAEIRMYAKLGADAIGMSTVPEVIAARAMGLRVLGISLITNAAAGTTGEPVTHQEVIDAGEEARPRFAALVRGVLQAIQ